MSQPVKRNNPDVTNPEEFRIKRPTLKGEARVEEVLSISPPSSPQQDVSLKRKLSPKSSVAVVDDIEQVEQATESKTQSVVSAMLSPPAAGLSDLPLSVFSTPPSKHHRRVSFSPSPGSEKGSARSRGTVLSFLAFEIAKERIEQSKLERRKKLQTFTDELPQRIEALEKDLQLVGNLSTEFWSLRKEYLKINGMLVDLQGASPMTKDEQQRIDEQIAENEEKLKLIDIRIKTVERALDELVAKLLEVCSDLKLAKSDFSCFYRAIDTQEEHVFLLKEMLYEQILNKCINRRLFLARVKNDIKKYKQHIIKEFYKKEMDTKQLEEISFEPVVSPSETHNRGEVATKIEFFQKNQLLFAVYYKPRDAKIDIAVIDFFRAVNRIPDDPKSTKVKLPEYHIVSFANNSENFSVWEYIDGKSYEGKANVVISNLKAEQKINSHQEKILQDKLRRLESLCQPIALSDLHSENVLFKNISSENPEIIPIDLESIQEDAGTGLYQGQAPAIPLTQQEAELVAKFRSTLYSTPFRLVPLATGVLEGSLLEPTSFEKLVEDFIQNLENQGYKVLVSKKELYHLLLDDFLNNDIPYLVSFENSIFYGPLKNKMMIAIKNLEQEKK